MNRLLVWDAPNMDMCLSSFYDRIPVGPERPNMGRLMNWLVKRCGKEDTPIACVFVNVNPNRPSSPRFHNWLRYLSTQGFYVFAKPKDENDKGDVDEDMLQFIQEHDNGDLREVIVASHDAQCFQEVLAALIQRSMEVLILGFSEQSNGWEDPVNRAFVDLQTVPDIFEQPPPRHIDIWTLPPKGRFFEPSGKPRATSPTRPNRPKRVVPQRTAPIQLETPE